MIEGYKVYGKPGCAGCEQAKALLGSKGLGYEYVDILKSPAAMQLFREKGFRGVPQIFHGDRHVGNADDLAKELA